MPKNISGLKPYTKENAKEMGRKGGLASVKARAEKKSMREALETVLNTSIKVKGTDIEEYTEQKELSIQEAIILKQVKQAMEGNSYAYKMIVDTFKALPEEKKDNTMEALGLYYFLKENDDEKMNQGIYSFLNTLESSSSLKEALALIKLMKELNIEYTLDNSDKSIFNSMISNIEDYKENVDALNEKRKGKEILNESNNDINKAISKIKANKEHNEKYDSSELEVESLEDMKDFLNKIINDEEIDLKEFYVEADLDIMLFTKDQHNESLEQQLLEQLQNKKNKCDYYMKNENYLTNMEKEWFTMLEKAINKLKKGYKVKTRLSLEEIGYMD